MPPHTIFHIFAIVTLGLMCGSELNVGALTFPVLNHRTLTAHIPVRAAMARLFGQVMPVWMAGSTALNLVLLLPWMHLGERAWRCAAVALGIQVAAIVFSLVAAVPINKRIITWTPETLPRDWKAQESRWDDYHLFRTLGLIAAFVLLVLSLVI